jgi:hypothetical protein
MTRTQANDLALTGIPRGGTTLACRLAGLAQDCVALFEPMDPETLPLQREAAIDGVQAFFRDTRQRLEREGVAPSKQRDGEVPDNPFSAPDATGKRQWLVAPGLIEMAPPAPGFTLAVKHNASFTALLPELARRMRVVAVVRNPLAVLASWNTVELPVGGGRIPAGERFDPALATRLDGEPDRLQRQLIVLEWFFHRFQEAGDAIAVVRYEDIVATGGQALYAAARLQGEGDSSLRGRNTSATYRGIGIAGMAAGLARAGGAWRHWYAQADIDAVAGQLEASGA